MTNTALESAMRKCISSSDPKSFYTQIMKMALEEINRLETALVVANATIVNINRKAGLGAP